MIHWFETPYKGTNIKSGFEVVIHGLLLDPIGVRFLCVNEEGVLGVYDLPDIAMDWRFTRDKGWHSIDDPVQD